MPKTNSRYRATITMAKYKAACLKLRAAWVALKATIGPAEFFEAEVIGHAMGAMARVPDSLRVQVCPNCTIHGYYDRPEPEFYGTSYSCSHPGVPKYDVRLDLWT